MSIICFSAGSSLIFIHNHIIAHYVFAAKSSLSSGISLSGCRVQHKVFIEPSEGWTGRGDVGSKKEEGKGG